jgi:hypothetical protein
VKATNTECIDGMPLGKKSTYAESNRNIEGVQGFENVESGINDTIPQWGVAAKSLRGNRQDILKLPTAYLVQAQAHFRNVYSR